MTITLLDAIKSLVPNAEVSVSLVDNKITWHWPEIPPVSLAQIQKEQQRLQQAHNWSEYQRNRAREYPSIEEQLDALYHAGVFPPDMAERIKAVNDKYPRPPVTHQLWPNQTDTVIIETKPMPETVPVPDTTPKMTVDEWFEDQSKTTPEQWLEQQKNQETLRQMSREEWLAEQARLK